MYPLQSILWPHLDLCSDPTLWLRLKGAARLDDNAQGLTFDTGGEVHFDTYGNLFNLSRWQQHCALQDLQLSITGTGQFDLTLFCLTATGARQPLQQAQVTLRAGDAEIIEIADLDRLPAPVPSATNAASDPAPVALLGVSLTARGTGQIEAVDWISRQAPQRSPDLLLVITSFRRPEALARSLSRFADFIATSPLKPHINLLVVDNDRSLTLPQELQGHDNITLVGNDNLGGAGGFARGALEAQARGASHCLFMDDDAAVPMQAIARSWSMLAHATDPSTAIAGALAESDCPWKLWENGAVFDRICHPQHGGLDLRDPQALVHLERDSTPKRPDNFYGGWWFFAFPLASMQHLPFPFFVRGDDVNFSLIHAFNILTLNGVMAHQDEDFTLKESPLTVYLDLRSHLAHHLTVPHLNIGRIGLAQVMLRFHVRAFLSCHYETLAAINLACADVLSGPRYFAENADLADRRRQIGLMTQSERWHPHDGDTAPTPDALTMDRLKGSRALSPDRLLPRLLMKATLNGHLLPFFSRLGDRVTLPARLRGARRSLWGAAEITYVSLDGQTRYRVRHNKRRAWAGSLRLAGHLLHLLCNYRRIQEDWQQGYTRQTTSDFWQELLHLPAPNEGQNGTETQEPTAPARHIA